jgi:hypothetical protein
MFLVIIILCLRMVQVGDTEIDVPLPYHVPTFDELLGDK